MKRTILLALAFGLAASAVAAEKRPFALDDLYRVKSVSGLALSPAGNRLVFEVASTDLRKAERNTDLYEIALATGALRQLTTGKGSENSEERRVGKEC